MDTFQKDYIDTRNAVIRRSFSHLNDKQIEAVLDTEGPMLILAGAGSGKTTVLINRIANLVKFGRASSCQELPPDANEAKLDVMRRYLAGEEDLRQRAEAAAAYDRIPPWSILAITFTNKAADELKERLADMLGEMSLGIWARTFHSACVRILRRDAERLGYPSSFTIYDTTDSTTVMSRLINELYNNSNEIIAKDVLRYIDKARDAQRTPEEDLKQAGADGYGRKQNAKLYQAYSKRLKDAGAMDFEDLIYNTVRLLTEFPDVRTYYQKKFRYVLIDEYQDTNNLQYQLASLIAGEHKNLCVVGDDDQSIYAFRGATIKNILSFERQYKQAHVVRLEQNYRSTGRILEAANAVVANNIDRKAKHLWTEAEEGDLITLFAADNAEHEAQYVVHQVLMAVSQGRKLEDHAVLYRTNAQSRVLEQAFLRNGIRPRIVKGNPFFERAEIKDMLAYFHVLLNPADDLRLTRIINVPPRGIGQTTIDRIRSIASENDIPMFTVISLADSFPELARAAAKLKAFSGMMNELSGMSRAVGLDVLYDALLERTGYAVQLTLSKKEEDLSRLENIRELKNYIVKFMEKTDDSSLASFIDDVSLYTDLQNVSPDEDTVSMMTVHSAKGLEFDTVFLTGMEGGVFPSTQSLGNIKGMEEERRLAYVAITRAKRHLYITYAHQRMTYGKTYAHSISPFVKEIPWDLISRGDRRPQSVDTASRYPARKENRTQENAARGKIDKQPGKKTIRPPKSTPKHEWDFKVGDRVRHKSFGDGQIISMEEAGGDCLTKIKFENGVTKQILMNDTSRYLTKLE